MVDEGRSRDPIAVCRQKLKDLGLEDPILESFFAEHKGAGEASNDDFPPQVLEYLNEGIDFALKSPLPEPEEGGMWVFKEAGR